MDNANPYLPPEASLAGERTEHVEGQAATLRQRFLAAMLDGLISFVVVMPLMFAFGMFDYTKHGGAPSFRETFDMALLGFIVFVLMHGYFLKRNGQTIGKKIMRIRITGLDDTVLPLSKILIARYLPISAITLIPAAGNFLPMVDALFIFRSDRRCIHDMIAGTKVVQVRKPS